MNQIILIITGSILALASSFFIEIYRTYKNNKDNRKNIKIILKLELKNILVIFEKMLETYGAKHYFEFKTLDQFTDSLRRLDFSRDKIIFLKEEVRKEEIISLINSLSIFQSDVRSLENYAWGTTNTEGPHNEFCKGERQVIALKIIDLKRRVQDFINYIGH